MLQRAASQSNGLPPRFTSRDSLVLNREHPLSDLWYKRSRYKVYWGGRGAAKTWAFAEALLRLAATLRVRILCVREFQTSIADSAHRILVDTIERLGIGHRFTVTDKYIRSASGSEFIFKGLHNNSQGIRSTEGVDICWVEEAQSVGSESWRALLPTIRNPRSEIWVSFNLVSELDATYQMFVTTDDAGNQVGKRADTIIHKVNYDSNPFFAGSVLEAEMEEDKKNDYHLYEHIWLGMPLRRSNSIIFNDKYRVESFDDLLWKGAERLFFGADFGFANDPSTLMRAFILPSSQVGLDSMAGFNGNSLLVSHAQYGYHVDTNKLPDMYDLVPDSRDWPIKGDAARPETISHLRNAGFIIAEAEKWQGCVEDGIGHLRSFDQIIIHERCKEFAKEAYLYRYKVDPKIVDEYGNPQVLPIVIDKHNHGWDGIRYGLDGYIMKGGVTGQWERLGAGGPPQ